MDRQIEITTQRILASDNSTNKKLAVQWLKEALCYISSPVVADSFRLRNRQLLVAAKRCKPPFSKSLRVQSENRNVHFKIVSMKRWFFIGILLFMYSFSIAQQVAEDSSKTSEVTRKADMDSSKVFTKVEKEASFKGGAKGWLSYLEHNLDAKVAERQGLPKGIYTVVVEFVVDEDGIVTEVKPVAATKACTNCIKEAVRVIKSSPKWTPAMQSGKSVKYKAKQSIKFSVYDF